MPRPVLAVLGGSFDPPHLGHTLIPTYLLARGLCERVLVAPTWSHPFAKKMTPFAERMALTRLAMAVHGERVEVSDIEARLAARRGDGPSYSYDLLRAVADEYPDFQVRLVIGSDITLRGELERWHRYEEIAAEFTPIVVPRMGFAEPEQVALPEISSTAVRGWLARFDAADARAALASALPAAVLRRLRLGQMGHAWLIGAGHVTAHAAPWLAERGWTTDVVSGLGLVEGTAELPPGTPRAIWILCRDAALPAVASALLLRGAPPVPTLHAAGSLPARTALAPLADAGVPVGTLHPICSLRADQPRGRLSTCMFGLEGDPPARDIAQRWIEPQGFLDLQGLDLDARARYHAACALAANHLAVLSERSAEALRSLGLSPEGSARAIGELMRSALDNLQALGVPRGISGPASRGDLAALERHVGALPPEAAEVYRLLSAQLLELLAPR